MAQRGKFVPEKDDIHQIRPIYEGDREYGYKVFELYRDCFGEDLSALFIRGASGLIFGDPEPKSDEMIRKILMSQMFCRPEDAKDGTIAISGGQFVHCKRNTFRNINLRWYRCVRFQGDFAELLQDDYPQEETGTMAVALAGAMAMNSIMPSTHRDYAVLDKVVLAGMSEDENHEKPWIAVEFDVYVHQSLFFHIPFPHDRKTGYVPIDALEKVLAQETETA